MASDDFSQTPYIYIYIYIINAGMTSSWTMGTCSHPLVRTMSWKQKSWKNHISPANHINKISFCNPSVQLQLHQSSRERMSGPSIRRTSVMWQWKFYKLLTLPAHHDWENLQKITGPSAFLLCFLTANGLRALHPPRPPEWKPFSLDSRDRCPDAAPRPGGGRRWVGGKMAPQIWGLAPLVSRSNHLSILMSVSLLVLGSLNYKLYHNLGSSITSTNNLLGLWFLRRLGPIPPAAS